MEMGTRGLHPQTITQLHSTKRCDFFSLLARFSAHLRNRSSIQIANQTKFPLPEL